MSETFHLAVCEGFRSDDGTKESDHWLYHRPYFDRGISELKATYHNRRKHNGDEAATVVSFESDAVGCLPREQPPAEELVA